MWGAIIGDLAGSIYEYEQIKQCKPIKIKEYFGIKNCKSKITFPKCRSLQDCYANLPLP